MHQPTPQLHHPTTHSKTTPKPRPLAPTHDPLPTCTKLANLLMQRSISFVHSLNARDIPTPWKLHATPDYIHHYTTPSGDTVDMTAAETMQFFADKFSEFPGYRFEIVDTTVQLEEAERPAYGTVWQTCRVVDGGEWGEKERVAIYSWRRETDRLGVESWRWWRQECPSTAAVLPF
ncbi:hypothetical protein M409DRAFT_22127 [Zasmidium cellare ATCC 36951]|uniref:SnoaL-like domain-containing protein n=1 Tax=Zasmidium cellare ATCC 36951 TaxID=1080233 RepID=A0A6A6CMY2_ZASCE|nr:uncharacterized protein M409DRAFT_22127 [Zasmidium cellare ATCC 36951]KAF2167983.1 hypothetical protein M409DRAFT_22127 [Zasmidium cellare ATCC 36951]